MLTKSTMFVEYQRLMTEASYAGSSAGNATPSVALLADIDARRLTVANALTSEANAIRRRMQTLATQANALGVTYKPSADDMTDLASLTSAIADLRRLVRSFDTDRSDIALSRGRARTTMGKTAKRGTPKVLGGPVTSTVPRAFTDTNEPTPSDYLVCPRCGVHYDCHTSCTQCTCGGTLRHDWTSPAMSERQAVATCRATEATYEHTVDTAGIWQGTVAIAGNPLLATITAACCAQHPAQPDVLAAAHEEHCQSHADWLASHARAARIAAKRPRGKRGGRRG